MSGQKLERRDGERRSRSGQGENRERERIKEEMSGLCGQVMAWCGSVGEMSFLGPRRRLTGCFYVHLQAEERNAGWEILSITPIYHQMAKLNPGLLGAGQFTGKGKICPSLGDSFIFSTNTESPLCPMNYARNWCWNANGTKSLPSVNLHYSWAWG